MSATTAIIIATAIGPLAAVLITLWHQDRRRKFEAKEKLFFTLMTYRKSFPISREWASSLNLIDVVFSDNEKVRAAWGSFYDYIHVKPMDMTIFGNRHLVLLSEISKVLGYKNLQQTDMDKFYNPQVHGDETVRNYEIQTELLRVLKASERFSPDPRMSLQADVGKAVGP